MKGFKDTWIYVDGQGVVKTSLSVDKGLIAHVGPLLDADLETLPEDWIIVPGFIDEHIHGAFGHDVMEGTPESLHALATHLPQEGVAFFCPTTLTMPEATIVRALHNMAVFKQTQGEAEIIGIHLEGPFLSAKYVGAQDPRYLRAGDPALLQRLLEAAQGHIKIVTFAPECGGEKILPILKEAQIVPAIGHSDSSGEQTRQAIIDGVRLATHCYNAMRGLHHRDVGVLGEVLLNDAVMAELIADLKHVNAEAIRLLFRMKGKDKIILISDAMEAKGLGEGTYTLGTQKVMVHEGSARLVSGALAGSVLKINEALKNIAGILPELSFTDVVDLVTKNPAKNLGLTHIGTIKVGNRAVFTIIDRNFSVKKVVRF